MPEPMQPRAAQRSRRKVHIRVEPAQRGHDRKECKRRAKDGVRDDQPAIASGKTEPSERIGECHGDDDGRHDERRDEQSGEDDLQETAREHDAHCRKAADGHAQGHSAQRNLETVHEHAGPLSLREDLAEPAQREAFHRIGQEGAVIERQRHDKQKRHDQEGQGRDGRQPVYDAGHQAVSLLREAAQLSAPAAPTRTSTVASSITDSAEAMPQFRDFLMNSAM